MRKSVCTVLILIVVSTAFAQETTLVDSLLAEKKQNEQLQTQIADLKKQVTDKEKYIDTLLTMLADKNQEINRLTALCQQNGIDPAAAVVRTDAQGKVASKADQRRALTTLEELFAQYGPTCGKYQDGDKVYYIPCKSKFSQKTVIEDAPESPFCHLQGKVMQVINPSEILLITYNQTVHVSGLDTSPLVDDSALTVDVIPNGYFNYTTVGGSPSKIYSFKAVPITWGLSLEEFALMLDMREKLPDFLTAWDLHKRKNILAQHLCATDKTWLKK